MMTREPYSQEAEQGVLGAMLIKPELIDILSAELTAEDFFFADNRRVFKAILALQAKSRGVDFLTVADYIGSMDSGDNALAYCAELHKNTPSVANAKAYAGIVLERSIDRALIAASETVYEIAHGDSSTQDKISQAHAALLSINSESSGAETITAREALEQHVDELERRLALGDQIDGLGTGIASLDATLRGLKPEGLYVIAGRPKMGKTTLAMNIADASAITQQKQVLVYSLEMSNAQLTDKSLASVGGIPLNSLKDGTVFDRYTLEVTAATNKIANSGLSIYARKSATINQIRAVARRHKLKHGLDLVVVDHIGLVNVDDHRASPVQRITEITRQLKMMAKELGVPVIALSQLNRELEKRPDKRPIPSDLRDSGSIEQDADLIMFVYRDEVYNPNTEYRGVAEIIIGVARDIEPCTVRVRYQGKYSKFSDLADDYDEPPPAPSRSYSSKSLLD
jgi:replicative DNA helicase